VQTWRLCQLLRCQLRLLGELVMLSTHLHWTDCFDDRNWVSLQMCNTAASLGHAYEKAGIENSEASHPCTGPCRNQWLLVASAATVQYGHWFLSSIPYPQEPCVST